MDKQTTKQMVKKNKKYLLIFGYRRFNAYKKLGFLKIPSVIHETGEKIDIPMEDIILRENTRLRSDSDLSELMTSIKSIGLLQPIGVTNDLEMPTTQFISLNLAENFNRKDLTALEVSEGLLKLKREGLSVSEIATRVNQPKTTIQSYLSIIANTPEEHLKKIRNMTPGEYQNKKGNVSVSTANAISILGLPKYKVTKLYEEAEKEELSSHDIDIIGLLINEGFKLEEAIKNRKKYVAKTITFILNSSEFDKINMPFKTYINRILKGKIPLNKKLLA